ncbi:MAG: glycosyltransferase [Lachnospiraceae bacterium]|nr:glycosyltransferase [Lachnospiraceae bacterium]
MEILIYRYNSICEPDIIQAFESFGITVHQEKMEMTDKQVSPSRCSAKITEWLLSHELSFVFSVNFYPAISYTCNHFKVPYVCWSVDSPVAELFSNALKNEWNRIFLFDRAQYAFFHPYNPEHIFYLPLATNVRRWEKVIMDMTEEDYRKYGGDISFVGSLYSEKSRYDRLLADNLLSSYTQGYVNGLIQAQQKVFGYNFIYDTLSEEVIREIAAADPAFYRGQDVFLDTDRYLVAHQYIGMKLANAERISVLSALSERFHVSLYTRSDASSLPRVHVKGGAGTLTEMPKIFQASKINLNITMRPIETGLSLRIWDVLGCGGFLLTNYQAEIPEYFEIGKDLEVYENMEDLMQKADYYLHHEAERLEIALNGYEKTARYHTYEMRLAEMIRILSGS